MRRLNATPYKSPALEQEDPSKTPVVEETPPGETPPAEAPPAETPPATEETPPAVEETPSPDDDELPIDHLEEVREVENHAADLDDLDDEVDETSEIAECLESIYDVLAAGRDQGPMPAYAAEALNLSLTDMYHRVGMERPAKVTLEAFTEKATGSKVVLEALDGMKEAIAKIWRAIVQAVETAMAWMVELYHKVTASGKTLEGRAKKLAQRAKDMPQDVNKPNQEMITNPRILKAVASSKGQSDEVLNNTTKQLLNWLVDAGPDETIHLGTKIKSLLPNPTAFAESFEVPPYVRVGGLRKNESLPSVSGDGFELHAYVSGEMLGGKELMLLATEQDLKGHAAVQAYKSMKLELINAHEHKPPTEVDALGLRDCNHTCEIAELIAEALQKAESKSHAIVALKKELAQEAKRLGENAAGLDKMAADKTGQVTHLGAAMRDAQTAILSFLRMTDRPAAVLGSYALVTAHGLLDWVEISLKMHEKALASKEAKPEVAPEKQAA